MASQQPGAQKSSSRWGSFLANVESRLDTILADEETAGRAAAARGDGAKVQEQPGKKDGLVVPATSSGSSSRTASTNRAQDRLNERLAKAMANKNVGKKGGEVSQTPSEVPSRSTSPANATVASPARIAELPQEKTSTAMASEANADQEAKEKSSLRSSPVNGSNNDVEIPQDLERDTTVQEPQTPVTAVTSPTIAIERAKEDTTAPRTSMDSKGSMSSRPSLEITRGTTPNGPDSPKAHGNNTPAMRPSPEDQERIVEQLRAGLETAELRRQQETHEYLERIDALQAKLQYLTKETAEIAKRAASEAIPGSADQKLAKKDEQIALLIEEGQKLSQTELKHMSIIKKLRAKAGEDEKSVSEAKREAERYQKSAREASEKARRAETAEKLASERVKSLQKLEKDLQNVTAERDSNDTLVQDLQIQLSEATSAAQEAEAKANSEELERERLRASDLADELSNLRVEKELAEKALQNELRELGEKGERERERQRVAEIERRAEQDTLESRLETYRARAEEASAGQGSDVQAKLLRQIETLQNQYAVASENWQGIEGSLLSRVTTLEKERDEIAKREVDIRRKARETNTKSRRLEEDLERQTSKLHDQEHELSSFATQLSHMNEKLSRAEAEIAADRNNFKAEREIWEAQQASRLEEERVRVREELLRQPDVLYQHHPSRTESPANITSTRKSSITEYNKGSPALGRRRISGLALASSSTGFPSIDKSLSRQSSDKRLALNSLSIADLTQPLPRTDSIGGTTHPPLSPSNKNSGFPPQTPSSIADSRTPHEDDDDGGFFDDIAATTPATPDRGTTTTSSINDLISVVSTATAAGGAGAGPSVQLVERMSAAVRRLESEKAAHKDELVRLGQQRDEAREQVVALIQDTEGGGPNGGRGRKELEARLRAKEQELGDTKARYLTTLEMLGEKSERVEELVADVADLKEMYRALVVEKTGGR